MNDICGKCGSRGMFPEPEFTEMKCIFCGWSRDMTLEEIRAVNKRYKLPVASFTGAGSYKYSFKEN